MCPSVGRLVGVYLSCVAFVYSTGGCGMRDERTRFYYYDPFVNFVVVAVVGVLFLRCITTLYYAIC